MNQCQYKSNYKALIGGKKPLGQNQLYATNTDHDDYQAQESALKRIPAMYKEYKWLFREVPRAEALPKHQLWDHTIPIEEGKHPMFGPIYQLSEKELAVLKEYIDINLKKGFI